MIIDDLCKSSMIHWLFDRWIIDFSSGFLNHWWSSMINGYNHRWSQHTDDPIFIELWSSMSHRCRWSIIDDRQLKSMIIDDLVKFSMLSCRRHSLDLYYRFIIIYHEEDEIIGFRRSVILLIWNQLGGGGQSKIFGTLILSYELEVMARTCTNILRVALGSCAQCCPGEASEQICFAHHFF